MINPEVEKLLNDMLAITVHRELIASDDVRDMILDVRQALIAEAPVPVPVGA